MHLADDIFKPEKYAYSDYKIWEGDWELVNGYPFAMSPSPKRTHQWFVTNFARIAGNSIAKISTICNCEVQVKLDWIINDNTVVRPDCMIVCEKFTEDYLQFPPALILEVSSRSTRLRDRNTKFKLYEMYGVKYFVIADEDKKTIEIYELMNNQYKQITGHDFHLNESCSIHLAVQNLWQQINEV